MSKHESQVIISDPREYQVELFERAKEHNIIAVLDTGEHGWRSGTVSATNRSKVLGRRLLLSSFSATCLSKNWKTDSWASHAVSHFSLLDTSKSVRYNQTLIFVYIG